MRATTCRIVGLFVAMGGVVPAVIVLGLAGCAGSGEGLDQNGRPFGSDTPQGPLTADFASIQAHVFTPICTACHAGANAPQGLRLDSVNSYNLLVGVPSTEVPSLQRVKPNDPANSYIIQKLEGTAAVGVQMPFGGPPLSSSTIAVIRQWITDGAQRTAAASASAADNFKLATSAPADGDSVGEPPAQIMLGFNRELDVSRADATTIRLERFNPDNPDEPAVVVPTTLSVPSANPLALLMTPSQKLAAGHYRVVVSGQSGGISDISGQPLVNDLSGTDRVVTVFSVGTATGLTQ